METNIRDEIQEMKKIELKQQDLIGTGPLSNAYRYKIHNTMLTVKCFEDESKAQEENAILQKVQGCPGIIQYYGIKKLDIEIIGAFSESYNGYAIFFQECSLDFKKILGIITKLRTKEVFNILEALQNINLQPIIIQLISSFNQLKPNVNNNCISAFNSDILQNFFYSTIILALFEEENIQLSRIHAQFDIHSGLNNNLFHQNCDNKGPTLVIMHSKKEPNSFFGGMAASSWNSNQGLLGDLADECSWLFKIEVEESMIHLHQWKCCLKSIAIYNDPDCGPFFGYCGQDYGYEAQEYYQFTRYFQLLGIRVDGGAMSQFSSNNKYYEKVNLNNKTRGLLFQLKNKINFPQKVQREILNEKKIFFDLDSCEVFAIKK